MGTGALLIGFNIVGTQNLAILLGHIGSGGHGHPQMPGLGLIGVRRIGIAVAGRYYLVKDRPDSIEVGFSGPADKH